jgi:hypothetical protein
MTSDQARQRAERNFKREERAQDGRKAMIKYEAQAVATRKKTARLKALRLAKEAQARKGAPKATEMASREINKLGDEAATDEERARRKRTLISGPKEFRSMRRK